ncbi:MAG: hypothetical protein HOP29_03305 [Phycisphaerales bacterium]|nr:hypothetical protein [Phycisphaerales bacterium]
MNRRMKRLSARRFFRKLGLAVLAGGSPLVLVSGCPTDGMNGTTLTAEIECPIGEVAVSDGVLVSAASDPDGATLTFTAVGGATVMPQGASQAEITVGAAGTVTVTVTASEGTDTATDTCVITFAAPDVPPPTLSVSLACPRDGGGGDGEMGVTATTAAGGDVSYAFIVVDESGDTITTEAVSSDAGSVGFSFTAPGPGEFTITVTASAGDDVAADSCTVLISDEPLPITAGLQCPTEVVTVGDTVSVSGTVSNASADVIFAFEATDAESTVVAELTTTENDGEALFTYSATEPGAFVVTVTVNDGNTMAMDSCPITVVPVPPPTGSLPASGSNRTPFASSCAQNVVACTTSFPDAAVTVVPGTGQGVAATTSPVGFIVFGSGGDGFETVQLRSTGTTMGNGATTLTYSWSYGATDANPCTLPPGTQFSVEANPNVAMLVGVHYIRLTVENELIRAAEQSGVLACGTIPEGPKSDFVELVIDVRDP